MMRARLHRRFLLTAIVIAFVITVLWGAFAIINPTPPRTVIMSTGPAGSNYHALGKQYREHFRNNGIDLVLRESAGAEENIARLNDPASGVSVGLASFGLTSAEASPDLRSLGALFFEPLWCFYRNAAVSQTHPTAYEGFRIAIGPEGSLSNFAGRRLLSLLEVDTGANEILALAEKEAVERLGRGEVDLAIFATAASSPYILELLAHETIELVDFIQADAYIARFPSLTKLIVPAGVGSLARQRPATDKAILSVTGTLLVRHDLHPAIQSLLLDAATQIHSVPDLFYRMARFPKPESINIPLSDSAQQYFRTGRPFLQRYLPFWLAVLVKQAIVLLLPLVGIVYPALRLMPSVFSWAMRRRITRLYGELRLIEVKVASTDDPERRYELADELEALDTRVRRMRLPSSFAPLVYTLRTHINVVRNRFSDIVGPARGKDGSHRSG